MNRDQDDNQDDILALEIVGILEPDAIFGDIFGDMLNVVLVSGVKDNPVLVSGVKDNPVLVLIHNNP